MHGALAFLLALAAASPAAAQTLGIAGPLGNEEGCEHLRNGELISDLWLVLRPDSLQGAVIGCEFIEVLGGGAGTENVTGLCSHEGEDAIEVRRFVVAIDPEDPQARLIYEDGALWNRVAACK